MLIVAAALIAVLGVAHSILGERYILRRLLRRDDLPRLLGGTSFTAGTIRFAWHITSLLALGLATVIALVALDAGDASILLAIGITFLACAILPVIATRGRHLSWAVFLAAGILCLVGAGTV